MRGNQVSECPPKRSISAESVCLGLFCLLDMLSSAYLFHAGLAVEWNPLLRPFADAGIGPFILAKTATFAPCLIFMEWYRHQRPRFASLLLRGACGAYLGIYLSGTLVQR